MGCSTFSDLASFCCFETKGSLLWFRKTTPLGEMVAVSSNFLERKLLCLLSQSLHIEAVSLPLHLQLFISLPLNIIPYLNEAPEGGEWCWVRGLGIRDKGKKMCEGRWETCTCI